MSNPRFRSKLPIIYSPAFTLILFFLFAILLIALVQETIKFVSVSRQLSSARQEINKLEEKNQSMTNELSYLQDDFSREKEAREKLNMLKPGEKKIIIEMNGKDFENGQGPVLSAAEKIFGQKIIQWIKSLF
ncbi:MAG: septum formation initiator family protein [Patescibacteria group bacterium]